VAVAIQARWEIEEYATIFFKDLMLNPPRHPKIQEERIKIRTVKNLGEENRRTRGAIFCQVKRIALWNQLINSMTWGNQKWVGAIPAFTPREMEIILLSDSIEFSGDMLVIKSPKNTITKEARA